MLSIVPNKYIGKIVDAYKQTFGPENDASELLDIEGIDRCQSLIGSLQPAVSLGHVDIATVVMGMSSFRAVPRQGHLESVNGGSRLRTDKNDFSPFGTSYHDWTGAVYGDCKGDVLTDAALATDRFVATAYCLVASLMHVMISSGESVTGRIHLLNQTFEAATYGSAFVAARTRTVLLRYDQLSTTR